MTVKFSIILPVRNGGEFVKECVQSIQAQSYTDFNCIVLDNKSTDGTPEWINSLNDNRITIIPAPASLSIEQNWARILQVEKNEFMTMVGHDDVFAPDYLDEMAKLISKHPSASLYQAHFRYINEYGNTTRLCYPMDEVQKAHEFLAFQMNGTIHSTGTGYVMRSADFNAEGGMPTNYTNLIFSDFSLWTRLAMKSYKATSLRECFSYREHMSVSRTTNGEQYASAFHEYVRFMHMLKGQSEEFATVIERYGYSFLMQMCESLAHRLLKTPPERRSTSVASLIEQFKSYAQLLLPHAVFDPLSVPRIRYAQWLDRSAVTRNSFRWIKKWMN